MSISDTKISANTGGSYSIESRLDEVRDKLSNIYRKVKELESMIVSCTLNPLEIIPERSSDAVDEKKTITPVNYAREGIFVVSIPPELITELNKNRDIEYSLEVAGRELNDEVDELKKQKHNEHQNASNIVFPYNKL